MKIVLGIDPGSRITGYGVLSVAGNRLSHVAHGNITAPANGTFPQKLACIFNELQRVIETYKPEEASIENVFLSRNAQSALKLGHARGVALLAAELNGLPMVEYTPTQIKMAVAGYGRADKQQIQDMVQRLLRLPKRAGSDASDALAAAICHAQTRRFTVCAANNRAAVL